jgi:hypothetical protein
VYDIFTTEDPYELAYKLGNFSGYSLETAALVGATEGIGRLAGGSVKGTLQGSLASGFDDVAKGAAATEAKGHLLPIQRVLLQVR